MPSAAAMYFSASVDDVTRFAALLLKPNASSSAPKDRRGARVIAEQVANRVVVLETGHAPDRSRARIEPARARGRRREIDAGTAATRLRSTGGTFAIATGRLTDLPNAADGS